MKVISLIKRAKGSSVEMDDQVYKFNKENEYTTDVVVQSHIDRFLEISEGYLVKPSEPVAPVDTPEPMQTLSIADEMFEPEGDNTEESGDEEHTSERDELVSQFIAKFGKKPHHKLGIDKIKQAIES